MIILVCQKRGLQKSTPPFSLCVLRSFFLTFTFSFPVFNLQSIQSYEKSEVILENALFFFDDLFCPKPTQVTIVSFFPSENNVLAVIPCLQTNIILTKECFTFTLPHKRCFRGMSKSCVIPCKLLTFKSFATNKNP